MITLEKLKSYGADTAAGLARCMNNEAFYLKLVNKVIADDRFGLLKEAIDAKDADKAFEITHAMKGMYGNLSISPVYEPICELTEIFRAKSGEDPMPLFEKARVAKDALTELAK